MKESNQGIRIDGKACYNEAKIRGNQYFDRLYDEVIGKRYVPLLMEDIKRWHSNHKRQQRLTALFRWTQKKPDPSDYHKYLEWLRHTQKIKPYLKRSISYIVMRDLGKRLDSPQTQTRISEIVDSLSQHLSQKPPKDQVNEKHAMSLDKLYRRAEKEGLEDTFIWLLDKLYEVAQHMPKGMDGDQAQRKLIKIIVGVLLHESEQMEKGLDPETKTQKLDVAIRLGYAYGLTYPFIDDLLDAKVLDEEESCRYVDFIQTALATGDVPELEDWEGDNRQLMAYIYGELKEAFGFIKAHQPEEQVQTFLEDATIFFEAQEVDRAKRLDYGGYTNQEIYSPIILKSAYSRLMARSVLGGAKDEGFEESIFYYGIYNQLADDFADMFDDQEDDSLTPYTYYMRYRHQRPDLINPFELYWVVLTHLIHDVYDSDAQTCDVMMSRAINGLRRFKQRIGEVRYTEVMAILGGIDPEFENLIQKMVDQAEDVDFFDKLFRDHFLTLLKQQRQEQQDFLDTVHNVGTEMNKNLKITQTELVQGIKDCIVEGANYSIQSGGKRLRPIMTWVMGVREYGLDARAIWPLLNSLEYMHTASLIFDDLPSQDDALNRRGRPTLHQVYNPAIAELTGLFLTQRAIEEQTYMTQFDAEIVLNVIRYGTQAVAHMCRGQAVDLNGRGKALNQEQLNAMCFYKTGIAFEVALVMPAMLAKAKDQEIQVLKQYAYHAGIAFQIKDDLLDAMGDDERLGKLTGKDVANKTATFVTILGIEGAKKAMWQHYCLGMEALEQHVWKTGFMRQLLDYIVTRDH
ncbi:MAG: polyprenyl synthetase family protein [Cellulosilyticaceae bacterium]